jgi:hypothetical protein
MSLDVYLDGETTDVPCTCSMCGNEHSRKETQHFYDSNITHNLNRMAREAGIYEALWRPDECQITKAAQLIEPLRTGLALMESDPPRFKKHDAENGWGTYEQFLPWIREYLSACEQYPDANISVSR